MAVSTHEKLSDSVAGRRDDSKPSQHETGMTYVNEHQQALPACDRDAFITDSNKPDLRNG